MSLFDSIGKKTKLSAANKLIADARKNEGNKADQLFKSSYQYFAEVIEGDAMRAEALYKWGFALLHQAKAKSGAEAINIYKEAITRFSFCLMIDPNFLGAAIDGGVACMDLARSKAASFNDELYDMATSYFEKANAIQAGSASYNLACIFGLLGAKDECLSALETAKARGSLPDVSDILADPDLKNVKKQAWFLEFIDSLEKKSEPIVDNTEPVVSDTQAAEPEQETTGLAEAAPSETAEEAVAKINIDVTKIDQTAFAGQHFKQ